MADSLQRFADMSVLVIDDAESNLTFLHSLLEHEGLADVRTETDARQVGARLADQRPDLVLLDLHMPHRDGLEVLEEIQRFGAGSYLPVLVLTADTTIDARDRVLRSGAQDFLIKPLDTVETCLRIANLLETQALYSSLRPVSVSRRKPAPSPGESRAETLSRVDDVLDRTLQIVYQPIVDTGTQVVVGHEALSRFPDGGVREPAQWFVDAFAVGRGVQLEWLAATTALDYLALAPEPLFLTINMSPATVLHIVEQELCEPRLCPRIVIELTEHVPVEDYAALHRALQLMRSYGARIAADDLGSGYAGFRHLLQLRPDFIKLDISLVGGIHRSNEKRALTKALVGFADEVGAVIVAEGVEDVAELALLRTLNVPLAQGYHLGRPGPLAL